MKPWYVYILKCGDKSLYTGTTNDLENRLNMHNYKKGAKYTASRLPVTLVWQEEYESQSLACKREAEIKKWPRIKKLKLIKTENLSN